MIFDWIEDGVLAACPLPATDGDLRSLYDQGIRAIVTLTERPLDGQRWITAKGLDELDIRLLHMPIDDFFAPTREQAEDVIAFIDEMEAEGRPVLVHCLAGQGRTGSILHAYYLAKGYSLPDAKYQVSLRRPICDFNGLSEDQKRFIEEFAQGRTIHI